MTAYTQIVLRLVLFPILVATTCVGVPHLVFTRQGIDVPATMATVASVTWVLTVVSLLAIRKPIYLLALAVGTSSVVAVWGLHILASLETFRMYIGIPSVSDFTMAACWWGSYFAIQFAILYLLHSNELIGVAEFQRAHPGFELAGLFGLLNFGLLAIIAITTFATGSYHLSFPWLATLNLPLQTIKDWARPGMGSGGYIPASMILYAVLGTSFQLFLAWLVCRLANKHDLSPAE
jgi:hypothetical protein